MAKRIKVGVIGAGRIGKIHTENIKYFIPDAEVVAVSDINVEAIRSWAEGLGIPRL